MELIDKDAVLAEIEKLKGKVDDNSSYSNGWKHSLRMVEIFLDTIETKEVNLEKEIDDWYNNIASEEFTNVHYDNIEQCARHFLELGLKYKK